MKTNTIHQSPKRKSIRKMQSLMIGMDLGDKESRFCVHGANASPSDLRQLKLWMAGLSLLGAGGVAAGIMLLVAARPGWVAGAALAPTVLFALVFAVALLK